jgi:RHS repeat-associated protein
VTLGANDDLVNDYAFDALNRVKQIKQSGQGGGNTVAQKRFDFTFKDDSQLASIIRSADLAGTEYVATTTYDYDGMGRLLQLWHAQDTTDLAGYDYTYDAASRIEEIDSLLDDVTTYSHDYTGQLTDADHIGQPDEAYTYDENRILKYDNGNDESIDYAWDHRNRLTTITFKDDLGAPVKIVHQVYDIFNRWIGQQIDEDADDDIDSVSNFVYDDDQIALEFDGAADTDLTHRYTWGASIDQLLADEQVASLGSAGSVIWPLTDHLGTIRDLAEYTNGPDTTSVENHIQYDSFGNIIDESDDGMTHRFGFTGRPFDAESGLQNNLNRWYDPAIGQWISEDPIGFSGGLTALRNYVGNSTLYRTDPNGLVVKEVELDFKGQPWLGPSGWNYQWGLAFNSDAIGATSFFDIDTTVTAYDSSKKPLHKYSDRTIDLHPLANRARDGLPFVGDTQFLDSIKSVVDGWVSSDPKVSVIEAKRTIKITIAKGIQVKVPGSDEPVDYSPFVHGRGMVFFRINCDTKIDGIPNDKCLGAYTLPGDRPGADKTLRPSKITSVVPVDDPMWTGTVTSNVISYVQRSDNRGNPRYLMVGSLKFDFPNYDQINDRFKASHGGATINRSLTTLR